MNDSNPYQQLYRSKAFNISGTTTIAQAEQLSIQMSMIYNAFGIALKDAINLLSHLYFKQSKEPAVNQIKNPKIFVEDKNKQNPAYRNNKGVSPPVEQVNQKNEKGKINFQKYQYQLDKQFDEKPAGITKVIRQSIQYSKNTQRIQKARGKKEREQLNGYSCIMCEKFYEALGDQFSVDSNSRKLCDGCSRHRSNLPGTKYFNNFSQQFGFDD